MDKFCTSTDQYVNSCNDSCTLVESFLTNTLFFFLLLDIFLPQTQVSNYNCLNWLLWVSDTVFFTHKWQVPQALIFTPHISMKYGAKVICAFVEPWAGTVQRSENFWPINGARLFTCPLVPERGRVGGDKPLQAALSSWAGILMFKVWVFFFLFSPLISHTLILVLTFTG